MWLLVIDLGIVVGAGLFEHRIALAGWLPTGPDGARHWDALRARRDDTGRRFWILFTTTGLTLLTLASLILAWSAPAPGRWWWLAAAAALVDRAMTFGYLSPPWCACSHPRTPRGRRDRGALGAVNVVRLAVAFVAWLLALRALTLLV